MKKGSLFQRMAAAPHIVWMVMFIVAPMLFVLYFAFTDADGKFSLSNISTLSQYGNVFVLSIAFALIATVICLVLGYPLAYFMARSKPRTQKLLMVLIMLPMWCNLLIRTYALMALLDNGGLHGAREVTINFTNCTINYQYVMDVTDGELKSPDEYGYTYSYNKIVENHSLCFYGVWVCFFTQNRSTL